MRMTRHVQVQRDGAGSGRGHGQRHSCAEAWLTVGRGDHCVECRQRASSGDVIEAACSPLASGCQLLDPHGAPITAVFWQGGWLRNTGMRWVNQGGPLKRLFASQAMGRGADLPARARPQSQGL